jgi:microcystin-dependent protein
MAEPFIGEIRMFGGNFAPQGWLACEGQTLPIGNYEALYNLIGTTYGGDGATNFKLPDLRGRVPIHNGTSPTLGTFNIGQAAGAESVALTSANMPQHSHTIAATTAMATQATPGTSCVPAQTAAGAATVYYISPAAGGIPTTMNAAAVTMSTGGGAPHNNVMPFQCVTFIIATNGIYPSQG